MQQSHYHIAQINIARLRAPLSDPMMADFVAQLARINAIADVSPGFVWRLQTDDGDATSIRVFDDDRMLVNMSVWESIDALHNYTYRSTHSGVFRQRNTWFEPLGRPALALWWVPAGTMPTPLEGLERLDMLVNLGPTATAFTFKMRFPPPVAAAILSDS